MHDCCYFVNLHYKIRVNSFTKPVKVKYSVIKILQKLCYFFSEEMASPRTRRVLAELRPKDENNVS